MTALRILVGLGGAALTAAIVWAMGADDRGLGIVLGEMFLEPWSIVTLIDLYLGFVIMAVVICLFERSWLMRLFWAVPLFFLGNVWAALWLVFRLAQLAARLRRD